MLFIYPGNTGYGEVSLETGRLKLKARTLISSVINICLSSTEILEAVVKF